MNKVKVSSQHKLLASYCRWFYQHCLLAATLHILDKLPSYSKLHNYRIGCSYFFVLYLLFT